MIRSSEMSLLAKARLPTLLPGHSARFAIPTGQLGRRILYGIVNGVAYRQFGPGTYRLRTDGADIVVTRLRPQPQEDPTP
jgi:hypothetical protein